MANVSSGAFLKAIGEKIKATREAKDLSLREMSSEVWAQKGDYISFGQLGYYERGEREITKDRLRVISTVLNTPVEELLPLR